MPWDTGSLIIKHLFFSQLKRPILFGHLIKRIPQHKVQFSNSKIKVNIFESQIGAISNIYTRHNEIYFALVFILYRLNDYFTR